MAQDDEVNTTSTAENSVRATGMAWRIIELVTGGIFIFAGVLKAMEPVRFANDIENYHVIPWMVGVRLAFYLPWLEIFCGLALIVRRLYSGALSILVALMLIFIAVSVIAKARGIDITCGCFGVAGKNLPFAWHLVLDVIILSALVMLLRFRAPARRA